ncbi:hypothetical protein M9H77_28567 [Catharanthus roseus]|uniref:Uncharacterized protein n=1 Tax=Catharanthus roseus TaxID=4058 RepID=A0ACC0AHY0_CATRO|nr:hypothetical protein M9H77_28567 [Catharanthus roseus]
MRRCLEPQCLRKSILHHVHPVVWRPACLMRLDRMGGNTLPKLELSQHFVMHVWLNTVKVRNEPVPRGNPTSPNLLSPVRFSVGCPTVYFHSYNPTWDTVGCMACKLQYPVGPWVQT